MVIQHTTRPLVAASLAAGLVAALTAPTGAAAPAAGRGDVPLARVADVRPGTAGSDPSRITAHAGGVYFVADDGAHGPRVWRSDGTAAGTTLVSAAAAVTAASELAVVDSTLFFTAGDQLWRSDGTEAGTQLVKDLGTTDVALTQLTVAGNLVWFLGDDGVGGQELWRSDGTEAGTVPLTNRPPGADAKPLDNLTAVGSSVWFTGSDGTDIVSEVWRSDGTPAGTAPLTKFRTFFDTYPGLLTPAGGHVYFVLGGGSEGRDVFRIAAGGTTAELVFGDESDYVHELQADGDRVYISSTNAASRRSELWLSDGTPAGSQRLAELPAEAGTYPSDHAQDLTMVDRTLFFTHVDADHGPELWRSNGTIAGTRRLTDLPTRLLRTRPAELTASDGRLWFVADEGRGPELWVSDGTTRGTHPVDDTRRGRAGSVPTGLADADGTLFMGLDDGAAGRELWATQVDTAVARPRVRAPKVQRVGRGAWSVRVRAGAGEWVESTARGRVRLPGVRKPVVLRTARATSYAGRTAVLTPAIPQKARRAVARATGNSRTKVVAKLVVTLRDSAGNAKKVVRTIRLS